jgi:exopolysaccharide biosynthesis protein
LNFESVFINVCKKISTVTKSRVFKYVYRTFVFILSFALVAGAAAYGVCAVVMLGPSPSARNMLVATAMETSAARFLPYLFLSPEKVQSIVDDSAVKEDPDTDVNTDEIEIPSVDDPAAGDEWADYPDGIRIENVKGPTYNAYVMIIRDPSRVYVATSSNFTKVGTPGKVIMDVYEREGAVAALNGGGFHDANGMGNGDTPTGLTFSKGKMLWGSETYTDSGVVGFNKDNVLLVGRYSGAKAYKSNMRDCVNFGPVLIMNGKPMNASSSSGSLNPRSGIGQRADGAVLFLVIEGRIATSLGGTYNDMIEIFMNYGAVNACNLDGGSSTSLIYNGEQINQSASLYGARRLPTFFMVK